MRAISSMATRRVLADLAAEAEAAGFPALEIESVGGVDAAARVAAGEAFDLVFLADGALGRLANDGHVSPESVTPLLRSQTAAAVAASGAGMGAGVRPGSSAGSADAATPGSAEPAVPTEEAGEDVAAGPDADVAAAFADAADLRAALRAAGSIGYSTGPSGAALVRMIDAWGLRAELGDRLVQARPGIPVARSVADGAVELGFQQLSELIGEPGIRILGVLPPDCAIDTVFAGAVATTASDPGVAKALLASLQAAARRGTAAAHSFVAL